MLELIEDSLARLLDAGDETEARAAAKAESSGAATAGSGGSNARPLLDGLHEAGMLDVLAIDDEGEMPLAWRDAARLFMLIGAKAPDAPVADAILARALLGAAVDSLPAFTVLATRSAGLTITKESGDARVSGMLDGVPWGGDADAAVAIVGGDAAGDRARNRVVLLARSAASEVRCRGTGIEARAAWTCEAAAPLAVIDCPPELQPALLAAAARAAQIAGAMRAARELTVRYANERVQFGKPIGRQQAIQHRIAVMAEHSAMVGAAAMLAFASDGPPASAERVAVAKGLASEYAAEVAAAAHAVHGAIGFTDEYALARLTRRLWQWRSEWGGSAVNYEAIGARVLAEPAKGVWQSVIETTRL